MISAPVSFSLPGSPVPVVLSNFWVLLAGLLLGGPYAALSMSLYILFGALGLPVFAGSSGGFAHLIGKTGGFLWAFIVAAYVIGLIAGSKPQTLLRDVLAVIAGVVILFLIGIPWLVNATGLSFFKALEGGMLSIFARCYF